MTHCVPVADTQTPRIPPLPREIRDAFVPAHSGYFRGRDEAPEECSSEHAIGKLDTAGRAAVDMGEAKVYRGRARGTKDSTKIYALVVINNRIVGRSFDQIFLGRETRERSIVIAEREAQLAEKARAEVAKLVTRARAEVDRVAHEALPETRLARVDEEIAELEKRLAELRLARLDLYCDVNPIRSERTKTDA